MTDARMSLVDPRPRRRRARGAEPETAPALPPPNADRWRASQKAAVVIAIRTGLLNVDEALARYAMAPEELRNWDEAFDRGGIPALRARGPSH